MSNANNNWKEINIFVSSEDDPAIQQNASSSRRVSRLIRNPFVDPPEEEGVPSEDIEISANEQNNLHLNYRHGSRRSSISSKSQSSGKQPISPISPFNYKGGILSYDRSQVSSPAVEKRSFLEEATNSNDYKAIQDGLNFALGDSNKGANWFPVTKNDENKESDEDENQGEENEPIGYADDIELDSLSAKDHQSEVYQSHSPVHFQNVHNLPNPSFDNFVDLDSKRHLIKSKEYKDMPASPAKFTDALTRISDRIAGDKGHHTPQLDDSPSKQLKKTNFSYKDNSSSTRRDSIYGETASHITFGDDPLIRNIPKIVTDDNGEIKDETSRNVLSDGLGLYLQDSASQLTPETPRSQQKRKDSYKSSAYSPSPIKTDFAKEKTYAPIKYIFGNSLKIFSPESKIRRICYKIAEHKHANLLLLLLLVFQVALLSYRQWNPAKHAGYFFKGYNWADYALIVINMIYTVEIIIKIIAFGFYDDKCMFEELNIPYPKNRISVSMFKPFDYLKMVFQIPSRIKTHFNKSKAKTRNKKYSGGTDSETQKLVSDLDNDNDNFLETDINDAEINDNEETNRYQVYQPNIVQDPSKSLEMKYGRLESHHVKIPDSRIDISYEKSPNKKLQKSTNTFLLNSTPNIENLHIKRAYIRGSWNRIDFLSMVTFWISLLLSINRYDAKHHIMLFRALSCLRILRMCNLTKGTSTILAACKSAIPQLIDVALFICCFWLFFGIIGVQSFKSSLTRHCVWYNPDDPNDYYVNDSQYCGSYLSLDGTPQPYITRQGRSSGVIKGFTCPKYSKCVSGDNPYGGTVNFDNILQSLEMVFVVMSANTFTDIMYDTMDSDNLAACLFYIFSIFILTVWLINIFIAVIVTSFDITRLEAAEKKKNKSERVKVYNLLGISNKDYTLNKEKLSKLRKLNRYLRYYYKIEFVFVILVLFDLFSQCFTSYDMETSTKVRLDKIETAFTIIFFVEIIVRFFLHFPTWRLFFYSKRNNFDLFLGIITFVTVLPPIKKALGQAYYWLTVFQLMRFYRAVLFTKITSTLWLKIMGNFRAIFDLALFFFILTFLTSIILARYFEGAIPREDFGNVDYPLHTLPNTFIALYVITSTENWTEILYGFQEYATTTSYRSFGAIFLIGWFIVSNMFILNVFIGLTARTLEVPEKDKRKQQLLQFINNMITRLDNVDSESRVLSRFKNKILKTKGVNENLERAVVNMLLSGTAINDFIEDEENDITDHVEDQNIKTLQASGWKRWLQVNYWRTYDFIKNPFYTKKKSAQEVLNHFDPATFAKTIIAERNTLISKQNNFLKENPRFNNVFYLIGPRHWLRRGCQKLVGPSYGERIDGVLPSKMVGEIFVVVVFLASIALVVTACVLTPLFRQTVSEKYGQFNWTLNLQIGFVVFFSIEFFIKILADGLIFTPNAYMRSVWNNIDLIVLISIWIELIAFLENNGNLSRIVRGLKALRALRLLTVSETARNTFHNTIFSGFYKIVGASIISLCLLFPFSIWGLNVLNGRLGYCLDGESYQSECFNEYSNEVFNWDVLSPNVYTNPYLEFDKFTTSFSTLFQIISLEGWLDLLINAMNSTGVGSPPRSFATPINGLLIVLFNFTSIIFILTLFVSVVIHNYSETTGTAYMTDEQVAWYHVKKFLSQVKPSRRRPLNNLNWFNRICYKLAVEKNAIWDNCLGFVLFLHVLSLVLECFPSSEELLDFRNVIFTISSALYMVDSLMILPAMGYKMIFKKKELFTIVVSCGAFVTTVIAFFVNSSSVFMNINKLFLVGMLSFIIPKSNRLSQLLKFASASLPSLISLAFTWVIIFLVYAIAMNQIFGLTKVGPNGTGNLNLRSVPKALIVLFRCSFGEGWNYIMDDYTLAEPYCTVKPDSESSDCGNKQYAYILFILWNIISMYIFVNMFISLILDTFSYINYSSTHGDYLKREEIRKFKATWQKFDPEGTGYILPSMLPKFLHLLEGSISFRLYHGDLEIPNLCNQWIVRHDRSDPYNITANIEDLESILNSINVSKIRHRRKLFEKFLEEAFLTMELNEDPGISFTNILLQIPLYLSFEEGLCLNLIDFLERRLLLQKVERKLHLKKAHESIAAYACRWKYVENERKGIRDTNIDFGKNLRRNSYLRSPSRDDLPSIITNDNYFNLDKSDDEKSFGEESEAEISKSSSSATGVYIPKSPLHIYKTKFSDTLGKPRPKLQIQIPPNESTLYSDNGNISPFVNIEDYDDKTSSYVDLREIGKSLEDSSWSAALKEVQSASRSEFSETDKEER